MLFSLVKLLHIIVLFFMRMDIYMRLKIVVVVSKCMISVEAFSMEKALTLVAVKWSGCSETVMMLVPIWM